MSSRERFHAVMNFEPFDRLPLLEWAGWWNKTIDRWHGEGLPLDLTDRYAICRHFGLDIFRQDWLAVCTPDCPRPTAEGSGIIASCADYEGIRDCLYPATSVDTQQWEAWAAEQARGDAVLWISVDGFFWFARRLLGIEPNLYAFYDQPDLMHRINSDLADWMLLVIEQVCSICTPDFMTFGEDMSYNNGPMLSRALFDEFLRPYYDRVIPALRRHGVMPIIDSDGDIASAAPWFEDAGLAGILPLERQAGVDIAGLRRDHPKMRFIGHFDKMTMDKGEDAMRAEFERLLPTAARGGYDYSGIKAHCRDNEEYAIHVGGAGLACVINMAGFFRGMEQTFIDLATDDPAGLLLIDRFMDIQFEVTRRTLEAAEGGIDFMWMGEDLGSQTSPMISMDMFKKHVLKRQKRFFDLAAAYNIPTMLHTCGSSSWAYEEYIKVGLKAVDTLQPEATDMSPEYLKKTFGGRLAFHGCISTAGPVTYGTVQETIDDCRRTLEIMMPGGGYCFAPTHSLQDNSSLENVLAMYETVHKYGVY